jgi:hypothetical protein
VNLHQKRIIALHDCDFITPLFMIPRTRPNRRDEQMEVEVMETDLYIDVDYWYKCR